MTEPKWAPIIPTNKRIKLTRRKAVKKSKVPTKEFEFLPYINGMIL